MYPVFVRLTLDRSKEEVLKAFQGMPDRYIKTVVCEEDASRHHLHVLSLTPETNIKNQRQNVRNMLKKAFPELVEKTNLYSISKVYTKDHQKMGTYVVKDGNFCYYGFTDDEIKNFEEKSYPKFTKETFLDELKELNNTFQTTEMDIEDYIRKFYDLRIKYLKPISVNQAELLFDFQMMKKSKQYMDRIITWHINRFGYKF